LQVEGFGRGVQSEGIEDLILACYLLREGDAVAFESFEGFQVGLFFDVDGGGGQFEIDLLVLVGFAGFVLEGVGLSAQFLFDFGYDGGFAVQPFLEGYFRDFAFGV
jgi:hypothetical protein